ncbi:hypothetical protein NX774_12265 [Massilia agilis]|uniref:Uncharacterized protein n=1 Tax=Massilia agilis TaxID=1811226 RepID=A0ABT2DBJ7_9BURK|nr:hypothetical protein [Massilia agilis]MCS0808695.1 hypothetical protein [Massilia agilis]
MLRAAFYKGTHAGLPGLYNRLVRWWCKSAYSHVELIFANGLAASSSYMDGGVRFKAIDFDPVRWDFVELPGYLEEAAWAWYASHLGQPYDLLGNLHFVVGGIGDDKRKWFCSESVAAALGLPDPWRYDPATLYSTLTFLQPASAGFLLPTP